MDDWLGRAAPDLDAIERWIAAEPVRELTMASTLQRLLLDVVAVGDDFEWLPSGSGACSLRTASPIRAARCGQKSGDGSGG